MFSNSLLFLLTIIIFVGHCFCYANFPFPSLGVEHDKPPFCQRYTTARSCVNQQISGHPNRRWCIWSNTAGCFWNIPNIRNFYCRYLHGCRSPFCKWVYVSPGMYDCVATDIICLGQTTQQSCEKERFTCRWYSPGETADNPNFPICGNGLPPFGFTNFPFLSLGFPFSSIGILHANPPYCPGYSTARECTNQRFESVPSESWCVWSDANGCLWDVQNIKNFYCRFMTICQSPFCHPVYSPYECVATTDICLRQTNPQSCIQRRMICQWFNSGETPDNPNFPVCGTAID